MDTPPRKGRSVLESDDDSWSTFGTVCSYKDGALSGGGASLGDGKHPSPAHRGLLKSALMKSSAMNQENRTQQQQLADSPISLKSLYKVVSTFQNRNLGISCGYAQKRNNRKEMEDFVTVRPTFLSGEDESEENKDRDVAYFGVYDGHDGGYVAEYLRDNLCNRFEEQLKKNRSFLGGEFNDDSSSADSLLKLDCALRISFKEAASKVDREVLKMDSKRLEEVKSAREAALCGRPVLISTNSSDAINDKLFAGSCAVVAILYHGSVTSLGDQKSLDKKSNSPKYSQLSPSTLLQHTKQSKLSKRKILQRTLTCSSSEDDSTAVSASYDFDHDKSLEHGQSNAKALPSRASGLSLLSDLTASFRCLNRHESSLSNLSIDETQYLSLKMSPKHSQILAAVRDNNDDELSKFEVVDLQDLANDLKRRSAEFQKYADEYSRHAESVIDACRARDPITEIEKSDEIAAEDMKTDEKPACDNVSEISSMGQVSATSGTKSSSAITPMSASSAGSLTSIRSFSDFERLQLNRTQLSTVAEGPHESRQTSFATSHYPSQESYMSTRKTFMPQIGEKKHETSPCILVANVGDCSAVLCDRGIAILLTEDHTPTQQDELSRIKASGCFVSNKRVNGMLSVSRAFGDIKYKNFDASAAEPESFIDEESLPDGMWSNRHAVISMPDILELQILPSYEFIILASDGLWNAFTCAEAVSFVRAQLLEHGDVMKASDALIEQAGKAGATDNVSAVVICFNQI